MAQKAMFPEIEKRFEQRAREEEMETLRQLNAQRDFRITEEMILQVAAMRLGVPSHILLSDTMASHGNFKGIE